MAQRANFEFWRSLLIVMVVLCNLYSGRAQTYNHEFGKYSAEEFNLTQYPKDPSAEAVVIYDIGKSYFLLSNDGFVLFFERTTKMKIFTKAGLKWAEISIPYYEEAHKKEEIFELRGNTYNLENGEIRVSRLNTKNSYEEKVSEHWSNLKIALPDVKEGSIVEISYKIRSPYLFNLRNWEFQNKIPVIFSEYIAKMIPFYEYTYLLQGAGKFDEFRNFIDPGLNKSYGTIEYQDYIYDFVMKDLPAFRDESFITSPEDYLVKINFQLNAVHHPDGGTVTIVSTWPKLAEEMLDNDEFGKYLKNCRKKGVEIADTMRLSGKLPLEKAKAVERFVKSNFSWNGVNDKFSSKSVKEFLISKTGNCADVNLFLAGMLNAVGIEASPVILSTRLHGKIQPDYPFLHFFNSVIIKAKIDSVTYLVDATEPLSSFGVIPTRCINEKGLVIQKGNAEWVNLKSKMASGIEYRFDLKPDPGKSSMDQHYRLIATGYEATLYRNKFLNSRQELHTDLLGRNAEPDETLNPIGLTRIDMPFELDFNKKTQVDILDDKMIISPFCNVPMTENPLKQPSRSYPVDFIYRKANIFTSVIVVPAGYKLLSRPDNINISNKMVKILFATEVKNSDTIVVTGVYDFRKDIYDVSEYSDLKGYFNRIVDKFNEKLVFIKEP